MTTLAPARSAPVVAPRPGGRRSQQDAAVRRLALAVLGLSLLLVGYWWAAGGGIGDLAGWGSGLTSLGRVTGLVASVLLLAQVLRIAVAADGTVAVFGEAGLG